MREPSLAAPRLLLAISGRQRVPSVTTVVTPTSDIDDFATGIGGKPAVDRRGCLRPELTQVGH
jgi:hypothetical protein